MANVTVRMESAAGEPYPDELWQELRHRLLQLGGRYYSSESVYITGDESGKLREYPQVTFQVALSSLRDFCTFIHEVEWIAETFEQPAIEYGFAGMIATLS